VLSPGSRRGVQSWFDPRRSRNQPRPARAKPAPRTSEPVGSGVAASETALLHLTAPEQATRTFGEKTFKLTGHFAGPTLNLTGLLTNNQSQPIADATLEVLQQTVGTNTHPHPRDHHEQRRDI
jgi:hypothetical protein